MFRVLAVLCLSMTGCASIMSESHYPVAISSKPPGSVVSISNKGGHNVYTTTTPDIVHLEAAHGFFDKATYVLAFESPDGDTLTINIASELDNWYIANAAGFLFGALPGAAGLLIDAGTGAMWQLPPVVSVEFK